MLNYSFYDTLFIFIVYCFIGWCLEVVYAATVKGKFVNRGFVNGPACPIYGFGVLLVVVSLEPIKENWVLLFAASTVYTSLLEFFCGYIFERFFHEKWWDYTEEPFNIKGYVCLKFSLLWGLACVLVINVVHPTFMKIIEIIPVKIGIALLTLFYSVLLTDVVITVINILQIRKNLRAVSEIEAKLQKLSESIGTNLSDGTIAVMERGEKLKETIEEREPDVEKLREAVSERTSEMKNSISDKKAEMDALREKLKTHISAVQKRSRRIRTAFPNIEKGRYNHIFKK